MTVTLYIAPAASGKTAYLVDLARQLAREPSRAPRVIVPTRLQARAWRERLALAGGAMGVEVGTFDDVYRDVLREAGAVVTRLVDPVQLRLLRTVIDATPLTLYASIRRTPGFVQALRDLIGELKAGGVFPDALEDAVALMETGPRLAELARLYAAYQQRLQIEGWADYAGIGWLAEEALSHDPRLASSWPCVIVDGFDDLTTVQLGVLTALASRVSQTIIALTGVPAGAARELAHKRFNRTRARLEAALDVSAEPLPGDRASHGTALPLRHLEQSLYGGPSAPIPAADAVTMVAVPDREAEVRAALRWIKTHIVRRRFRPGETALLARSIEPYRPFIIQTAAEYGLPIQVATGEPLRSNPAVAALLELLQVAAPGETYLAWRPTVAAWRSPYFDWTQAGAAPDEDTSLGIRPEDADALAWVARWGSVLGGRSQWDETFDLLCEAGAAAESRDEDAVEASDHVPVGEQAEALQRKFAWFCQRIAPPDGERPCRDFVAWLEGLIGEVEPDEEDASSVGLGVARRAAEGEASLVARDLVARDLAALNVLKDVLRGLVWAESAIGCEPLSYAAFLDELMGAIDAATYRVPLPADAEAVYVAAVADVRGISYRAVALLGLAEGEFPASLREDPFLRDADRTQLRERFGLPIDPSPENLEAQYFYEAITRPREALLLTRPRIADNGAPWQPSPFWEEVQRRLIVTPELVTTASRPSPAEAASWSELLESAAASPGGDIWAWIEARQPAMAEHVARGVAVLSQRDGQEPGAFDGDLTVWEATFAERLGPSRPWSASRLESYRSCPFGFFVGSILGLEPRQPPTEGLGARQLGNIYHHILEQLYVTAGVGADLAALLEKLPEVAEPILDAAPHAEQFRPTAWWGQTRQEILGNVQRSVEALETSADGFAFYRAERAFGLPGREGRCLTVREGGGDSFRVRGLIDRVDRDASGRLRVVDYKTAGPSSYTPAALRHGKKLQLPLYALAAQEALGLGEVVEGFYWHVQHAEASSLKLSTFSVDGHHGPQAAMEVVRELAWEAVRSARQGHFVPVTPEGGCPDYCPAAAFCWHYQPRSWGG